MTNSRITSFHSEQPRVTVGMPVYNAERYVESAIRSVLGQDYENLELVISDNGSTDRTEELCRQFAAQDQRVRYHRESTNRGVTWNYNRVVELARGKYFRWMASDDLLAPTLIGKCADVLDRFPQLVICYTKTGTIDSDGNRVISNGDKEELGLDPLGATRLEDRWEDQRFDSPRPSDRYRGVLLHTLRCHELYGLIVTDKLRQTSLERPYVNGEKVLLAELAIMGNFEQIPEYLFFSRWHEEQVSSIKDSVDQKLAQDPIKKVRFRPMVPKQFRCAAGYLGVIGRAQLSFRERLRCLVAWGCFLLQARKLSRIIRDALRGEWTSVELQKDRVVVPLEISTRGAAEPAESGKSS